MSSIQIEFVPLNELEIKQELGLNEEIDEAFDGDYEIIEESPSYYEAKCGDIFVTNGGKYIFVCMFCDERYDDFRSFGQHLECKHLNDNFNEAVKQKTDLLLSIEAAFSSRNERDSVNAEDNDEEAVIHPEDASDPNTDSPPENASNTNSDFPVIQSLGISHRSMIGAPPVDFYNTAVKSGTKPYLDHRSKEKNSDFPSPAEVESDSEKSDDQYMGGLVFPQEIIEKAKETPIYDNRRLYCVSCQRQFTIKASFTHHKNRHRSKHIFPYDPSPPEGKRRFTTAPSTSTDLVDEATPNYCNLCNRHFISPTHLRKHAEAHHGNIIPASLQKNPSHLKCKFCYKVFEKVLLRRKHEVNDHIEEKPFHCGQCPKQFKSMTQRTEHENRHNGIRPYSCSLCPKTFTARSIMKHHLLRFHSTTRKYKCKLCDLNFIYNSELELHMRVHLNQKNIQCDQCGQRFRQTAQLTEHLKRHENRRDYPCDVCGKMFYNGSGMRYHRTQHFSDRPHKCGECGKTFKAREHLKQHKQLHLPEKRYECKICQKKFAQNGGLYSHMKTHDI